MHLRPTHISADHPSYVSADFAGESSYPETKLNVFFKNWTDGTLRRPSTGFLNCEHRSRLNWQYSVSQKPFQLKHALKIPKMLPNFQHSFFRKNCFFSTHNFSQILTSFRWMFQIIFTPFEETSHLRIFKHKPGNRFSRPIVLTTSSKKRHRHSSETARSHFSHSEINFHLPFQFCNFPLSRRPQ